MPSAPNATTAPAKCCGIFGARESESVASRGNKLDRRARTREVSVVYARTVSSCGAAADYRYVRQRCQVVQSESVTVDVRGQSAIGDARADGDAPCCGIESHLIQMLERDLLRCAVGNAVEGVACPQRAKFAGALHNALDFLNSRGRIEPVGAVGIVAGPVLARIPGPRCGLARFEGVEHSAGECQAGGLQKLSFVQRHDSDDTPRNVANRYRSMRRCWQA